jgi:hypothetical protein
MANNFTTSVNIIRDTDRDFNYIPTPNASQVVSQIVNDFKKGIRSFNVVGTYGTGKSSFLLAFEQSIRGTKRYFEPNFIIKPKFDFVKFIGHTLLLLNNLQMLLKFKRIRINKKIFFQKYSIDTIPLERKTRFYLF